MKHYYLVKIGSFNVLNSVMKKESLTGLFFVWWCLFGGKKTIRSDYKYLFFNLKPPLFS